MRPESINILGVPFSVEYVDRPSDVDIHKRAALWGSVDYYTSSIRIYVNGRDEATIWEVLLHEILHVIASALDIGDLESGDGESNIKRLGVGLADTLVRNGFVKLNSDAD